jgi:hypothetical protein
VIEIDATGPFVALTLGACNGRSLVATGRSSIPRSRSRKSATWSDDPSTFLRNM